MSCIPGVAGSIPAFLSLLDETLSRDPVLWDALKPELLHVEPLGVLDIKTTKP